MFCVSIPAKGHHKTQFLGITSPQGTNARSVYRDILALLACEYDLRARLIQGGKTASE
jgi:hypothetical protein